MKKSKHGKRNKKKKTKMILCDAAPTTSQSGDEIK